MFPPEQFGSTIRELSERTTPVSLQSTDVRVGNGEWRETKI